MTRTKKVIVTIASFFGIGVATYIGLLIWVLASHQPLEHPLAQWPIWPIACTTRGCITTATWSYHHTIATGFTKTTGTGNVTPEQSLTTTIRKHLIAHAFLQSPVKTTDVKRYREDILHIVNENDLQKYVPLTLREYDDQVLMPFLQQEALLIQNKAETTEDLYRNLSEDRYVFLLLFDFTWDTTTGSAQRT